MRALTLVLHADGQVLLLQGLHLVLRGLHEEQVTDQLHDEVNARQNQEHARHVLCHLDGEVLAVVGILRIHNGSNVVGIDQLGLDLVENQRTAAEASDNNTRSQTTLAGHPLDD